MNIREWILKETGISVSASLLRRAGIDPKFEGSPDDFILKIRGASGSGVLPGVIERLGMREVGPIPGYDGMNVEEVEKAIEGLSKEELLKVLEYEKTHKNRKTVIETIEKKLGDGDSQ